MIITTTPGIDGRQIREYLGLVSSCVMVAFPGGAKAVQRGWDAGSSAATAEIQRQAEQLGADAIVGVKIDVSKDIMYATGTTVKIS